jgi:hypothetical protein
LIDKSQNGCNEVEPAINPLVRALVAQGVQTIGSCDGHVFSAQAPYVYFRASGYVASIVRAILAKENADNVGLWTPWVLLGPFDDGVSSCWRITAPYLEGTITDILVRFYTLGFKRNRINNDIKILADSISKRFYIESFNLLVE